MKIDIESFLCLLALGSEMKEQSRILCAKLEEEASSKKVNLCRIELGKGIYIGPELQKIKIHGSVFNKVHSKPVNTLLDLYTEFRNFKKLNEFLRDVIKKNNRLNSFEKSYLSDTLYALEGFETICRKQYLYSKKKPQLGFCCLCWRQNISIPAENSRYKNPRSNIYCKIHSNNKSLRESDKNKLIRYIHINDISKGKDYLAENKQQLTNRYSEKYALYRLVNFCSTKAKGSIINSALERNVIFDGEIREYIKCVYPYAYSKIKGFEYSNCSNKNELISGLINLLDSNETASLYFDGIKHFDADIFINIIARFEAYHNYHKIKIYPGPAVGSVKKNDDLRFRLIAAINEDNKNGIKSNFSKIARQLGVTPQRIHKLRRELN